MTEKLKQKRPPRKPFWQLLLTLLLVILNLNLPQWLSRWYWLYQTNTLIIHPNQLIHDFQRAIIYGVLFLLILLLLVVITRKAFKQNRFNLVITFILMPIAIMTAWGNLVNNTRYNTYELRSEKTLAGVTYYVGTERTFNMDTSDFRLWHFIYTCEWSNLCSVLSHLGSTGIGSNPFVDETGYPPPTIEVDGDNRAILGYWSFVTFNYQEVIGELGFQEPLAIPISPISTLNASQLDTLLEMVTNQAYALWSPDGNYLLLNSFYPPNPITAYQLPNMQAVPDILTLNGNVDGLEFSKDGNRILGYTRSDGFRLWDWETGELVDSQSSQLMQAAVPNTDGSIIALIDQQLNVTLYDIASQSEIARFDSQFNTYYWPHNASYSPDGRYIATISQHLRVWDTETGTTIPLDVPEAFDGGCRVDFSPDSHLLAATDTNTGSIHVFDVVSGERLYIFTSGEYGNVCGLDFSPDGKLLATGSSDGQLQVWDLESGERVANIPAHDEMVISTRFHPSGAMILTSSHDNHIRVWGVPD